LFSAILSAFLIEIRKGVQDTQITADTVLLNQAMSPSNWINGLWFFSLLCSVTSAFFASLAKGWVTKYLYSSDGGENWSAVRRRQRRFGHRKRLQYIVQLIPLSLHASLLFFSIGFLIYLRDDNLGLRVITWIVVVAMIVFYFAVSCFPFVWSYSPFDTPLTISARLVTHWVKWKVQNSGKLLEKPSEPSSEQKQEDSVVKAKALAWLLQTSVDKVVIRESVHAIAGLPIKTVIQRALLAHESVTRIVVEGFLDCMEDSDRTSPTPYLHAILRLLQPARPKESNAVLDLLIPSLDRFDIRERGIYEITLFVKACILRLDKGSTLLPELRYTAIPILQKCSKDTILKLLLQFEDGQNINGKVASLADASLETTSKIIPKFVCGPTTIHTQETQILTELIQNCK
jgi:hypothetical protein